MVYKNCTKIWKLFEYYLSDLVNYEYDWQVVYVGVMSPEENMIVICQNILLWFYSTIGYLLLLPFYQVNIHHSCSMNRKIDKLFIFLENDSP